MCLCRRKGTDANGYYIESALFMSYFFPGSPVSASNPLTDCGWQVMTVSPYARHDPLFDRGHNMQYKTEKQKQPKNEKTTGVHFVFRFFARGFSSEMVIFFGRSTEASWRDSDCFPPALRTRPKETKAPTFPAPKRAPYLVVRGILEFLWLGTSRSALDDKNIGISHY